MNDKPPEKDRQPVAGVLFAFSAFLIRAALGVYSLDSIYVHRKRTDNGKEASLGTR
jgi:hypothetical protein